jgi:neutral ceramidase
MRRFALWSSLIVALIWIGVGPHPADNSSYEGSDYQIATKQRLSDSSSPLVEGALRMGVAESDITPPIGHPLAGYGGRKPKASSGVDQPLYARALTLSVEGKEVTLLTADILLINEQMAEAIYQRSGLQRDQLYFTASHTHSGAGGWGDSLLEGLILGEFDADYFDHLVTQLTETIQRSKENLKPSELAVVQVAMRKSQLNRFGMELPTNDQMTLLMFRHAVDAKKGYLDNALPNVIFTIFGAHPTILSLKTHQISGDYPGYLTSHLKDLFRLDMALFASGSVGDAKAVKPNGETAFQRAEKYGKNLVMRLAEHIPQAIYQQQVTLGSLHLLVDMPSIRYPISEKWTLGPLVSGLFGDDQSSLQGLRIGPLMLFGFPGDYSGHLATELKEAIGQQIQPPLQVATTSFNGMFDGYLVSHQWFEKFDRAETRGMNFFGSWGGEYLNSIALEMSKKLIKD